MWSRSPHVKEQFSAERTCPGTYRGMFKDTTMSCAKMAEQIEMPFAFLTLVGWMKWQWFGLMSNYFDHLFDFWCFSSGLWLIMSLLWSLYGTGQTIIFSSCGFFLSSFFFFSPNLSCRTLDVCHTSTHGVALLRIQNAGVKCAARGSLKIQDAKKSPKIATWVPSHNFVGLYLRN